MNQEVVHRTFDLTGCDVTRLMFNYSVVILIADAGSSVQILIEGALLFEREREQIRMLPGYEVDALPMSPLLHLLHKPAKLVTFSSDGSLRLEMMDGTTVAVLKDDDIGWEANGEGSFAEIKMFCDRPDHSPWGN